MKCAKLLLIMLLSFPAFWSSIDAQAQGSGSTGGGDVVVNFQGQALLVDLLTHQESFLLTADQIKSRYFAQAPWSAYVVKAAPADILKCALNTFDHASRRYPIFKPLQKLSNNLDVGLTEAFFEADQLLMLDAVPGKTLSSQVDQAYQVPVAIFEYQTLILNERLFQRMDAQNQCALMTHELLRLLNFYLDESDVLNTDEIEATVRMLVLHESLNPELEKKLKNLKLGEDFEREYSRYLFETTERIDQMRRMPENTINQYNAFDFAQWYTQYMDRAEIELKARMELIRAKQMQLKQRQDPAQKQDAPELYIWNQEFTRILRGKTWRGENLVHPGRLNVLTREMETQK
jgi:hypothetical protein